MGTMIVYPELNFSRRATGSNWETVRQADFGTFLSGISNPNGLWGGHWWSSGMIFQSFLTFDTSELATVRDVVTASRLWMQVAQSATFGNISFPLRIHNFGDEVTGDAFVPADDIESLPLFGTKGSGTGLSSSLAPELTSRTGMTRLMMHTNDQLSSTPPSDGNHFQNFYSTAETDVSRHPYLQVQYGGIPDAQLVGGVSEGVYVSSAGERYLFARASEDSARLAAWINTDDR